ncbi:DUF302 domain-containing protein [Thiobacillus sedimenti]|uniref:DUF302 domain-containing protein n=1 Tax=Thiobacillus sedimenti TaxID=3110231 RepID=A0ABZ1CPC8_9PROT|nr:DUF302 domain-containing protein [Thiobacillus sp. SCUT-2]WRS40167.1 DUF302 domain-containing protein [Thiobacillus sp. SCUT-2]
MKTLIQKLAAAAFGLLVMAAPAGADGLIMARMNQPFPEAMALLQSAISARGYTITRLQQVNENLARREYKSDMYRVVYFGKFDEVRRVTAAHPELIPFLPLNITIFAEGDQALLVSSHPRTLEDFFPDPALKPIFDHWEADIDAIMDELREGDGSGS